MNAEHRPGQSGDSGSRDQRLVRALEEAERMAARGETDSGLLAARCGLDADSAARLLRGVLAFTGALEDDEPRAEPFPRNAPLPLPELPADYELLGEIGRGGMGVVYRARQRSLERDVAVKVLMPGELALARGLERFRVEARSLAKLRHRHIVAIHEIGETEGNLFYSMDLIEGGSLAERLASGPLSATQATRVMRQVTSAVAYSHGAGVVHRDLKPANVLLDEAGDAYVVDFGLALDVAVDRGLTSTGHLLGTPDYMSPEQARGDRARIGEASDVYALGAILYACLTARAPFEGLPLADKMHRVVYADPTAPRRREPTVPRDLETICLKAMSKRPEDRYATARALLEDLERFEEGRAIRARRPNLAQTVWRGLSRHAREVGVGVAVALVAVLLVWAGLAESGSRAFDRRLDDVRRLLSAGEGRAARLVLDESGLFDDPDALDSERRQLVDHIGAACDLELAGELLLAGDTERARELSERAEHTLEAAIARARYSRATGWPASRFEMLADLAIAQVQLGKTEEALATCSRFRGGLVREPWTNRLLDWMAPRLADRGDPGHGAAVLVVTQLIDWSSPGAFGDWLAGWPEVAPLMLTGILHSLPALPAGRREYVCNGLLEHNALSGARLRIVLARRNNRPVTLADRLEERLATTAEDVELGARERLLAASVLAALADLPIDVPSRGPHVDGPVARVVDPWRATRWAEDRRAALAAWLEASPPSPAGWGASTERVDEWRTTWFAEAAGGDLTEGEPAEWLAGFRDLDEPAARAVHRALERRVARVAPGAPAPFWPARGTAPPRAALELAWRTAFGLPADYRLTVAHIAWLEGSPTPRVLWHRELALDAAETAARLRVVEREVHAVSMKRLGLDWLDVRSPTLGGAPPGTVVVELDGALRADGGGVVLDIDRFDYDLFVGGPKDWWSLRRAGDTLLAGRVTPLGCREYGWPRHGTHTSIELIVAMLEVVEPSRAGAGEGVAPFEAESLDPRDPESWRERLAAALRADATWLADRAVPAEGGAEGEDQEPLETWLGAVPRARRVSLANQWALAALLPVPEARRELARVAVSLRQSGAFAELLDADAPFPECYEPGDCFERSVLQLAAARLAAGGARALDEADVAEELADFPMTSAQWAHRVLDAENDAVRDYALAQLDSKFTSDALWITLGEEARERGLTLPDWTRERISRAPSELWREDLKLAGRGNWTGFAVPAFALLFLWLLTRKRSPRSDRIGLAGCSLMLASLSFGRILQVGSFPLHLGPLAILLAGVGVRTVARLEGRSARGFDASFGLALAGSLLTVGGAGDAGRALMRVGIVLALLQLPDLLAALREGAWARRWIAFVRASLFSSFAPLALLAILRALWMASGGGDPLVRAAAWLGVELASLEKALGLLVYAPAVLVVLSFFATCLVHCQKEREREAIERESPVGPRADLTPEGGE